jgi:cytochrome c biogenesis protein ResB
MSLILVGAIITVLGLLMRALIRSQRVWLEETPEGCRVRYVGKNPLRDE